MKITFTTFILELSFSSDEKNKRIVEVEVEAGTFYSNKEKKLEVEVIEKYKAILQGKQKY
jgi:hypothetical protein